MKQFILFFLCCPLLIRAQDFKPYNNYDFVPGNQIIFEDDFITDTDGEFPAHWKLAGGQAVINTMDSNRVCAITKYYTDLLPNIKVPAGSKTKSYLPAAYTIEFDAWLDAGYDSNPGVALAFYNGAEKIAHIRTSNSQVMGEFPGGRLAGDVPKEYANEAFHNKWHHFAIAVKDKQLKVYMDQYRVLVIPDNNFSATAIGISGDASEGMPMLFKNFRLAGGGGMNMLGSKFTGSKIITYGITFDYNKAVIKPQSMGTLNGIVQLMKENPELKFEVGGHTDADGDNAYNLSLSKQRADAVKIQLVKMGIDAARLTTKGYGETKPVADNKTPEGKANNRRVEFVKNGK